MLAVGPLPQNSTARVFMDYVTGSHTQATEHTCAVRMPSGTTSDDAQGFFLGLLNAMGAGTFWTGWRVIRVRKQDAGTNFSIPAPMTAGLEAFVGTGSASSYASTVEAIELTMQGRSPTTGRRVDFSIYGVRFTAMLGKFRYGLSDGLHWAGMINYMTSLSTSYPTTIDGSTPTWYNYVNVNYNSYWEQRTRSV